MWVLQPYQFPGTVWANRSSAMCIRNRLKSQMTKEVWETWKFKVVGYSRLPNYNGVRHG